MVELYESQINSTEDLLDIADFLTEDPQYKKSVLKYIDNPFDADIERVGKGTFTVAVSKADSPSLDKLDPATALQEPQLRPLQNWPAQEPVSLLQKMRRTDALTVLAL